MTKLENKKWTTKVIWSVTSTDEWSLMTGFKRRSGGQPMVLFYIWLVFLVSIVQCKDESITR